MAPALTINCHYNGDMFGFLMCIRGNRLGLTWERGIEMTQSGEGKWSVQVPIPEKDLGETFQFKALQGDLHWETGPDNHQVSLSNESPVVDIYPRGFDAPNPSHTITGILFDVSKSMAEALDVTAESDFPQLRGILAGFSTLAKIASVELPRHKRFDQGFIQLLGVNRETPTCDFIALLQQIKQLVQQQVKKAGMESKWKWTDVLQNPDLRPIIMSTPDLMEKVWGGVAAAAHPRPLRDLALIAHELLESSTDAKVINVQALYDLMKPFIFGTSPMVSALQHAKGAFKTPSKQRKILFVISSGESSDGDPVPVALELQDEDVLVVTCYLTNEPVGDGVQLFSKEDSNWPAGAKTLFRMSSKVATTDFPLSLLGRAGWQYCPSGQSNLFLRANNLNVIGNFVNVIKSYNQGTDALLELIGNVVLNNLATKTMINMQARHQIGGTCYANAMALVFWFAMNRVVGHPDISFNQICDTLIHKSGLNGAPIDEILPERVKEYRLSFKEVEKEDDARRKVNSFCPLLVTYQLSISQWGKFEAFAAATPKGIMTREDIGEPLPEEDGQDDASGHAVILTGCAPDCLILMNSWGPNWGDNGFFRIANAEVLYYPGSAYYRENRMKFYDTYWDLKDLSPEQQAAYTETKLYTVKLLGRWFPSTQDVRVTCPLCLKFSTIGEHYGNFSLTKCPRCQQDFTPQLEHLLPPPSAPNA